MSSSRLTELGERGLAEVETELGESSVKEMTALLIAIAVICAIALTAIVLFLVFASRRAAKHSALLQPNTQPTHPSPHSSRLPSPNSASSSPSLQSIPPHFS